jgi:hypothetical protein
LTALAITQPAFLYSDQKNLLKAIGATGVAVLAIFQTLTMSAAMGTIPRGPVKMKYVMRAHRTAQVDHDCARRRGRVVLHRGSRRATDPFPRVAIHAFFSSTAFALAVKFALSFAGSPRSPDVAPWLVGIAVAFIVIWLTSAEPSSTGR